jgi:hypothetical protein
MKVYHIDADSETLLKQAPWTADTYMRAAIQAIDDMLGKGYAKAHPELVAGYMHTCALDFGAGIIARAIEHLDNIAQALSAETMRTDHPLMGETFREITSALNSIAVAVGAMANEL